MHKMENIKIMNIHTPNGAKVKGIFLDGKLCNGYDADREYASVYIKPNVSYTVKEIKIYDWSSFVVFEEHPDLRFNTVHFTNG